MAVLTQELKDFVSRPGVTKMLATVGDGGFPNIGPKGSTFVLDDESLAYAEAIGKHHYENVKRNPAVAIACVDWETREGYRFLGEAELYSSGEIYDHIARQLPGGYKPVAGVRVRVQAVYSLSAQSAGERVL